MISPASLSAFSASAVTNGRLSSAQQVQSAQPVLPQQVRAQLPSGAPALAAKPIGPFPPGQAPPRGSLLNLSV